MEAKAEETQVEVTYKGRLSLRPHTNEIQEETSDGPFYVGKEKVYNGDAIKTPGEKDFEEVALRSGRLVLLAVVRGYLSSRKWIPLAHLCGMNVTLRKARKTNAQL